MLWAAAAALAGFHAGLLAERLAAPSALDLAGALRWLGACGVLGALAWLTRHGAGFDGRRAAALGLAVVVLHAPVLLDPAEQVRSVELLVALPHVALPTLAALGLALLGRQAGQRPHPRPVPVRREGLAAAPSACLALVAPRPPPASC